MVYPGNDTKDWDMVMDINLRAVFLTVREAMKGMVERNYGKIINISSVAGLNGMAYMLYAQLQRFQRWRHRFD